MSRIATLSLLAMAAQSLAQPVCDWSSLGSGFNDTVRTLTMFDDGSGPMLCVGGAFTNAGGVAAARVARWNGSQWVPMATDLNNAVQVLSVLDVGTGPALYMGGGFTTINGISDINRVARLEGGTWHPLGGGVGGNPLATPSVIALEAFDSGTGPSLYAGGSFITADGLATKGIARWDGKSWSSVGSGLGNSGPVGLSPYVLTMMVHDNGAGPALYVGGGFTSAGGEPASNIAKWNGQTWAPLGAGLNGPVKAMTVFDDGTGPAVFAVGSFTGSGSTSLSRVAKWDGLAWEPLGSGLNNVANAMTVFDDGTGPALYVGGDFTAAGGTPANRIARWDGSGWRPLGSGVNHTVWTLLGLDDGTADTLVIAGSFTTAGGIPHGRIVDTLCWSDCNGNGRADHIDIASGAEDDCDSDFVPDTCELAIRHASQTQAPFTGLSPLIYPLSKPPVASGTVVIQLGVRASLGSNSRFVAVRIDGTTIATLFAADGQDCPTTPQNRTVELTAEQFNNFGSDGTILFELLPSPAVMGCNISFAELVIEYQTLPDCDGDGIWDECQVLTDPLLDCNLNGVIDACERYKPDPRDCDGNDVPDECELASDSGLDLNGDGRLDRCSYAVGDFNLDAVIDGADLSVLLSLWGLFGPDIGDLSGDGKVDGADLSILLSNWGPVVIR